MTAKNCWNARNNHSLLCFVFFFDDRQREGVAGELRELAVLASSLLMMDQSTGTHQEPFEYRKSICQTISGVPPTFKVSKKRTGSFAGMLPSKLLKVNPHWPIELDQLSMPGMNICTTLGLCRMISTNSYTI